MISMASLGAAAQASSYYTKDNYYSSEDARDASEWTGAGARDLGLQGNVELEPFKAALEGQLPGGGEVGTGPGGKRQPGLDMTFSAPKSMSLLALVGGDERLRDAEMRAVRHTIAWAEKNLAETRMQGRDGTTKTVRSGNLVVALFQHDTNRNLDPQSHVHAVIANATKGPDGKWRALHNSRLWTGKTAMASVNNAFLRAEVEKLGYAVELTGKHGQFEIIGIPREAIMAFSTRRKEVLEAFSQLTHQNDQTRDAVTIKTRRHKASVENRAELRAEWTARAAGLGLDLPGMVEAARGRALTERSVWDRVASAARDKAGRAALVAAHVGERLGLVERDPLMPDRMWSMQPSEIAAAGAVASAIRHLSERETSFDTLKLAKAALDLGLPITIDDVERRVAVLKRRGQLLAGQGARGEELTTAGAASTERRLIELVENGRDRGVRVVASPEEAGARLQASAEHRQGFKLNIGQEAAGRLLLAASDRIVNVQGVAGAGKSSMLSAVADVAREEGRTVLGLGLQNTLVRMLKRDTGIESMTIAKFLGRHGKLLEPGASPQRLAAARATFSGAILLVDEASMASNDQALKLAALAETLQVGRLAFVGDKRQLGAIDAGKPFEVLQAAGARTAQMNINLRAQSPALISAAAAANDYRPRDALAALAPMTTQVPGRAAATAAERWLALGAEQRERTMLLASGRQVRADINAAVQKGLREQGVLKGRGIALDVFDKVTTTREEERSVQTYQVGQHVEFTRGVPSQGISAGEAKVSRVDHAKGRVELTNERGRKLKLDPQRLAPNRAENSVRISQLKRIQLHEGDRIRWTDSDKERGLINADRARVLGINADGITVETSTRQQVMLPHGDPMLKRLDLGYALNAHMAQGLTADRGIAVFDSRERNLTNERLFLVNITRVRDSLELIVDDGARVERGIVRNPGDKTAALETLGEVAIDRYGHGARSAASPAPVPAAAPFGPRPPTQEPGPSRSAEPAAPEVTPVPQTRLPLPVKQLEIDL